MHRYRGLKDLNIGVFMGGRSRERDISLSTGKGVYQALKGKGLKVIPVDLLTEDPLTIKKVIFNWKIDLVFIGLHGEFGEDGRLQEILERINIPYTGSGPQPSRNAFDKTLTRNILRRRNILQPEFKIFRRADKLRKPFPGRVVLKPACQGSSIGVHIVEDEVSFVKAAEDIFSLDETLIAERFILGKEITVGVLEEKPLPPIGIRPLGGDCFSFYCKYTPGRTFYEVPARVSEKLSSYAQELALKTHRALGLRDFSRVDMIAQDEQRIYVLEANSIPGLTPTSLLPKACKLAGLDYPDLCIKMLELALQRKKDPLAYETKIF